MQLSLNTYENDLQYPNVDGGVGRDDVITGDLLTTLSQAPTVERVQTLTMSGYPEITYEMSKGKGNRTNTETGTKDKKKKKATGGN